MPELHVLEDDLAEDWMSDLSGLERYLAKHAAFADYIDAHERTPEP